jgi:aryl-alcohol dehydrogenase-like predicted oxidoreductase
MLPLSAPSLVLGGHSFIQQLGVDPRPDEEVAAEIVAECVRQGITWFDTTYQPERTALGKALKRANVTESVTVLAWNFFQDFDDQGALGGPSPYQPHSIDLLCDQLQRDVIDILVVHPVGNAVEDRRQEELAISWRAAGRVHRLGVWHPGTTVSPGVYEVAISPGNIADNGGGRFLDYRTNGWEALATSPFVRGWLLERLAGRSGRPIEEIADLLLRYAAFLPGVDRLVVSIRQPALVATNVASWRRGPLSAEETGQLQDLFLRFGAS